MGEQRPNGGEYVHFVSGRVEARVAWREKEAPEGEVTSTSSSSELASTQTLKEATAEAALFPPASTITEAVEASRV
jgi:hypothetical protein